jgi:cytochrome c oxidase subunit 2
VDNPLVLPVGRKIRFLTTSTDMIHSWWVPALGWKKDAIPGFINEAWALIETPGVYRGQCAELCGKDHAFMPVVVVAKNEDDFQDWLEERKAARARKAAATERPWTSEDLMDRGRQIYTSTSPSRRPPVTCTSWTWCGCVCSYLSTGFR